MSNLDIFLLVMGVVLYINLNRTWRRVDRLQDELDRHRRGEDHRDE